MIARRTGSGEKLASRFVSVIEPFKNEPLIERVRQLSLGRGSGVALEIQRSGGGSDIVIYDPQQTDKAIPDCALWTNVSVLVLRRDPAGEVTNWFAAGNGDGFLTLRGGREDFHPRTGHVVSVKPKDSRIVMSPQWPGTKPQDFVGRVVHFENDLRRTAHTIASAERAGDDIVLTPSDDLLIGRARVEKSSESTISTKTALPLAPIYRGCAVSDENYRELGRVVEVSHGNIKLMASPQRQSPTQGDDVWLVNVGSGDRVELPAVESDR